MWTSRTPINIRVIFLWRHLNPIWSIPINSSENRLYPSDLILPPNSHTPNSHIYPNNHENVTILVRWGFQKFLLSNLSKTVIKFKFHLHIRIKICFIITCKVIYHMLGVQNNFVNFWDENCRIYFLAFGISFCRRSKVLNVITVKGFHALYF